MKKILIIAVGLILALGLIFAPATVKATPILDFGIIAPTTGSISYAGGAAPLVGAGISVDNVVGLGTPLNNGVTVDLPGYFLNFSSGNFTGSTSNSWIFGPGGSISIANGVTLLSGTLTSASVIAAGGTFKVAITGFNDTKYEPMLNFYGLPTDVPYVGNFNLSFNATGLPPGAFRSTEVLSGDITNSPIPEPATMLLLGSGLIGLAGFARRKFRKN